MHRTRRLFDPYTGPYIVDELLSTVPGWISTCVNPLVLKHRFNPSENISSKGPFVFKTCEQEKKIYLVNWYIQTLVKTFNIQLARVVGWVHWVRELHFVCWILTITWIQIKLPSSY
jgi:hypothetical protein